MDQVRLSAPFLHAPHNFPMNETLTPTRHRFSVEDYHKLGAAGVLNADSRVELIDGELIDMAPVDSLHASVVNALSMLFARQAADRAIVSTQNPVSLPPTSEPQPDIALLQPRSDGYRNALPTADDVLLLVEVADTTLAYDRTEKLSLYAKRRIREVWIVNLPDRALEMYRDPRDGKYRTKLEQLSSGCASPEALPAVFVELSELLEA